MSHHSELEQLGRDHGWEVVSGAHSTSFTRGTEFIHVRYGRNRILVRVRVGATGGHDLTGTGKRERLTELLSKPVTKSLGLDDAPHCRSHIQFRSDCAECRSEREFG